MPKVIINKHDFMSRDIGNKVVMWLRRSGRTIKDLAPELGVTAQGAAYKVRTSTFTYADMLTIFDYLEVPDEEVLQAMRI